MNIFKGKTILITGGTGSFGKAYTKFLLDKTDIKALRIFSRDELKQWEMANEFQNHPAAKKVRYLLGDVRDKDRLKRAFENVDIVIHAAALKQIPAAEYNPMECIKTNVLGAQNVIESALDTESVIKVLAISSDKAAEPINLYGATKLCLEKLFLAANNIKGEKNIAFSVVRYGNVMGSRGSVIPLFMQKKTKGAIPITSTNMTRFNLTLEDAVRLVTFAVNNCKGGEIIIPKIPSYRITDLVKAIAPHAETKIVGIRPGEKLNESLITTNESRYTWDIGKYYVVIPPNIYSDCKFNLKIFKTKKVPDGFSYTSDKNNKFLTVNEIKALIKKHLK
jgi:UDP-N-acetylglucosamine 4,6-dehydratase (inverting)